MLVLGLRSCFVCEIARRPFSEPQVELALQKDVGAWRRSLHWGSHLGEALWEGRWTAQSVVQRWFSKLVIYSRTLPGFLQASIDAKANTHRSNIFFVELRTHNCCFHIIFNFCLAGKRVQCGWQRPLDMVECISCDFNTQTDHAEVSHHRILIAAGIVERKLCTSFSNHFLYPRSLCFSYLELKRIFVDAGGESKCGIWGAVLSDIRTRKNRLYFIQNLQDIFFFLLLATVNIQLQRKAQSCIQKLTLCTSISAFRFSRSGRGLASRVRLSPSSLTWILLIAVGEFSCNITLPVMLSRFVKWLWGLSSLMAAAIVGRRRAGVGDDGGWRTEMRRREQPDSRFWPPLTRRNELQPNNCSVE